MATTKSQVRSDFKYVRFLMQKADEVMKDKSITDFSESSDAGQLALELIASASTFKQWLDEQDEK